MNVAHRKYLKKMQYIRFHMIFDRGWVTIIRLDLLSRLHKSWILLKFANEQHWNFSKVLVFSNCHLLKNIFHASKHHNLSLLSFYGIMSLANFEILSSRKFGNWTLQASDFKKSQLTFTCSKSTKEILEKGVKYV